MKSEIRENSTFLRYYEIWQTNPSSVIFAPLAEMLILHECYEEAITICRKGLERNPDLISGRLALAKAYIGVSNYKRAKEEARLILDKYPNHPEAVEICSSTESSAIINKEPYRPIATKDGSFEDVLIPSQLDPTDDIRWKTVTMAEIFASQGNFSMARQILKSVLEREPGNVRAEEGLKKLAIAEEGTNNRA